jgi:hypothetical protein
LQIALFLGCRGRLGGLDELDGVEHLLEFLARIETRQYAVDLASAPSALVRSQKLPKSPSSTMLPRESSCGMTVNNASSTASVSVLLTVEIWAMVPANWRRLTRPLD